MPYTFEKIFAADPERPELVAANGVVTVFAPGDESKTPVAIKSATSGLPLPNPLQVNASGWGPALMHDTLDRLAWEGGGFSGIMTSYEGLKDEAVAARLAAEVAAKDAQKPTDESVDAGIQRANVPALVARTVADSPTVVAAARNAAVTAVDAALDDEGVLRGAAEVVDPTIAFAIADASGRQSWLSVTTDGGVPDHAVEILGDALRDDLVGGTALAPHSAEIDDVAFAVTDASGRRSELEVGADGRLTQRVITSIATRLPSSQPRYAARLACWGDSLTYSQVATGQAAMPWPERMGIELGVPVVNGGKPSHGSAEIATRQGGLRPLFTLEGNAIPASGPVALTGITPTDGWRVGGNYTLNIGLGTLAGVPGAFSHDLSTSTRYFTRTSPGQAVPVAPGTPFISSEGVGWRDAAHIIWAGTNNSGQRAAIMRDIDSMIAWIAPYTDRYIILPLTVPAAALKGELVARYGTHFEDHHAYLVSRGLADAGITPTQADTTAMAAGNIPPSLVYDGTHFTQAGYDVIGKYLTRRVRERGFFA